MNEQRYIVCAREYVTGEPAYVITYDGFGCKFTYLAALAFIREHRRNKPDDVIGGDYWLEPC